MTDYYERQFTPKELNLLKNNLYVFYRWFVASDFEENITAPHIKYLAYKLMDLTNGTLGKSRLGVNMPPQHSKSSLVTVAYPSWLILNNPKRRIFVVNAEKGLSQNFGRKIKNLLYNVAPFWGLEVSKDTYSKTSMQLTKKGNAQSGSIELTGLTGGITGRPVDYIVCDDLFKGLPTELTPTGLNTKWELYKVLIEQRLRSEDRSKLVLLSTRWHSRDIHGRILSDDYQKNKYEFIQLPAIATENDILGRKPGEPLWPQYYDLEFYKDKERIMGERQFQAIYQQKPLDLTSNFFWMDHLIWDHENIGDKYYQATCRSWDMAYTEVQGQFDDKKDYTAGVDAYRINPNHYLLTNFVYGQFGKKNIKKVQSTAKQDGLNKKILIETGTKGGAAEELYRLWSEDYLSEYNTKQSEPWGSKADRATALADMMFDGKIHVYIPDKELKQIFIDQFTAFPNGTHDDLVDACSYAILYLKKKSDIDVATTRSRHGRRRRRQ